MNPRRRTEDSLMQSARLKKWYVVLKHLPSNFGFKTLCLQKNSDNERFADFFQTYRTLFQLV